MKATPADLQAFAHCSLTTEEMALATSQDHPQHLRRLRLADGTGSHARVDAS